MGNTGIECGTPKTINTLPFSIHKNDDDLGMAYYWVYGLPHYTIGDNPTNTVYLDLSLSLCIYIYIHTCTHIIQYRYKYTIQ